MDRASALLAQLRDFFLALSPGRRMTFAALTAAVLIGTGSLAWWVQQPQYRVLYSGLGASDAGAVIEYLKTEKIPYRVSDAGGNIEVAAGRLYETRMALAGRGVPQGGGVGFEIFDKQTLGMTDFVQRLNYQRALQGELARSIAELDTVEAARVHLAMPERSLFVAEERRSSASVVLKLKPGRSLAPEQINGVVHLVAASVEGLRPGDVTVVDVNGQVLSHDQSEQDAHSPGRGILTVQREMEQGYTEGIESMLARVLGPGHALARVTVALDMAQVEKTEESFDPDRVAVRNEKRSKESSASGGGGAADSAITNEAPAGGGGPTSAREDTALNYEVSKVTSRRVEAMGAVRKLSVAVMLDGTWTGEGEARTFVPRPQEEIDRYRELIKRAVGFNEERGDQIEVASAPFQAPAALEAPEAPGIVARIGDFSEVLWRAAGLIVVLVVLMTIVKPFLLTMASRAPLAPVEPYLPPGTARATVGATGPGSDLPVPAGMLHMASQNPERTAEVIRQWLGQK
jgi:flagellar M-ring protein FliF